MNGKRSKKEKAFSRAINKYVFLKKCRRKN